MRMIAMRAQNRSNFTLQICNDDDGLGSGLSLDLASQRRDVSAPPYHRRASVCCCIRAGDTEGGGLDMTPPVAGLMIGMALRERVAAGW